MRTKEIALCHFLLAGLLILFGTQVNTNHKIVYVTSGIVALWGCLLLVGAHISRLRQKEIEDESFSINAEQARKEANKAKAEKEAQEKKAQRTATYSAIKEFKNDGLTSVLVGNIHQHLIDELTSKGFKIEEIEPVKEISLPSDKPNYLIKW